MIGTILTLAIYIAILVGFYKAISKAGQPGWSIFIPIYNIIVIYRVGGRTDWWSVLIPIYGLITMWQCTQEIAKRFGKGGGFGAGLFFLGAIFWPILGFGSATYNSGEVVADSAE
ncbi:MAG: DUF5684 domain-containing protein [Vicingaceae bacterium]|nr:DUF5684 domain-containing protein [Vicingaceae bacterium]